MSDSSELREQLRSAKAQYDALRYPGGDLASETFRELRRPRRWMIVGSVSLSALAAALIATLLWMQRPPTQVGPTVAAVPHVDGNVPTTSPAQFTFSTIARPAWPDRPDSLDAFPSRQGISFPSVPSMPSWDALEESWQSTSTTQESV